MSRVSSAPDLLGALHVAATQPAAPYLGGKRALSKRLVRIIDSLDHETYAEPFVGMCGVFLRRRIARRCEVVNDWSCDVATFYRIVQRHYTAFLDMLRFQLTTRKEFERLIATDAGTLTDLERAARFLYLQTCAFAMEAVELKYTIADSMTTDARELIIQGGGRGGEGLPKSGTPLPVTR